MQCPVCKHPDFYEGVIGPSCANPRCGDGNEWISPQEYAAPTDISYDSYQTALAARRLNAFETACNYAKYTGGIARAISGVRPLTKGEVGVVPLPPEASEWVTSTVVIHSDGSPRIRPNYASKMVYPDEFCIQARSQIDHRDLLKYRVDPDELLYPTIENIYKALAEREDETFVSLLRTSASNFAPARTSSLISAQQKGFAHVMARLLSHETNVECVVAGMGLHKALVHDDNKMHVLFEGKVIYFTDTIAPMEFFAIRGRNVVSILERKFQVDHQQCSYAATNEIIATICQSMVLTQPQLISHWEFV